MSMPSAHSSMLTHDALPAPLNPGLHAQKKEPSELKQLELATQLCFPTAHSSSSEHTKPLPVYPLFSVHEQLKPPGMLRHCPRGSHGLARHSLTSVQLMPSPSKPSGHEHVNPSFEPMHDSGCTQRWRFSAQ